METWLLQNYLQLNAAKCKYMTISRKHSPLLNYQLSILNQRMEKVTEFNYLGVWLSDNMSWSTHIEKSSTRALKQVGLIYRKFYQYSSPECLQQLYLSFVRPHLEYAVPVWDPHCSNHVQTLERVQKFALKMCYKAWKDDYDSLLTRSGLQSLNERRKYLKLCYLYQIIHGHFSCTLPLYTETSSDSCAILVNITCTSHMLELHLISSPSFHIRYHFGILCPLLLIHVTLYKHLKNVFFSCL